MRRLLFLPIAAFLLAAAPSPAPVALFNGANLENWLPVENSENTWTVKDGILHCTGKPSGYLRTKDAYRDYKLTVEWRWPGKGGNNGVLVHLQPPDTVWPKSLECQLHHRNAGDIWVIGGADFREHQGVAGRRVVKQEASTEKPLGEWNSYTVIAKGNTLRLYVNGVLQNVATECTIEEGHIALQSEGTPIEFRKVELVPLTEPGTK